MGQNDGILHLAKINPEGNAEWVKIIENGSYDEVNVDGNAFLFDHIEQTIDGGYIFSASYDLGNGDTDVAIIKFNSDGHMLELGN